MKKKRPPGWAALKHISEFVLSHDLEVRGILAEEEGVGESHFGDRADGDNIGRFLEIHRDLDRSLRRIIEGTNSDPLRHSQTSRCFRQ